MTAIDRREARRFHELDSLRGVAAFTVVLWHFAIGFPRPWLGWATTHFPTRLAFAGHQAVILFFVLSGFVLTLPGLQGKQPPYPAFLLKRVLRIYLPYIGALVLALCCDALFHGPVRTGSSWTVGWANQTWVAPLTPRLLLDHILFLGNYDWPQVNTAIWSLVFEMRVSIIFPLLLLTVQTLRARYVLLVALAGALAGFPMSKLALHYGYVDSNKVFQSLTFITIHYASIFLLGALLAANLDVVSAWYARASRRKIVVVILATIILFDTHYVLKALSFSRVWNRFLFGSQVGDWICTAGSLLLIVLAIHFRPFQAVLHNRLVHHLGKVSYSLYLVHGTVLFSLMHLLPLSTAMPLLFGIYLIATMSITEAFYRVIEVPSIHASKRAGTRTRTPQLATLANS